TKSLPDERSQSFTRSTWPDANAPCGYTSSNTTGIAPLIAISTSGSSSTSGLGDSPSIPTADSAIGYLGQTARHGSASSPAGPCGYVDPARCPAASVLAGRGPAPTADRHRRPPA